MASKSRKANAPPSAELASLFSALQVELVGLKSHVAERDTQIASLQETVLNLTHENALLKRRIYGNKTERTHTSELRLALGDLLNDEKLLQKQLNTAVTEAQGLGGDDNSAPPPVEEKVKARPKGRRDLSTSTLPRFLLEICDEGLEKSCKRIGFDESLQLMYRRGGFSVLVKRTAKCEVPGKDGPSAWRRNPKTLFPRRLLHSSVVGFLVVQKFALGVPQHRLEQHIKDQEVELDRGTCAVTRTKPAARSVPLSCTPCGSTRSGMPP